MSGNFQSSYTGSQLDAAIASYVNRSTGTIILDPEHLAKSLGAGYYSGVNTTFDGTGLTATANDILLNKTAVTSNGKVTGAMQSGAFSITLNPNNLSQSVSLNGHVTTASASLNYSSLTTEATNVPIGKTFIGKNGYASGTQTPLQMGTISAGSNDYTSYTITGLVGNPTSFVLIGAGWSGDASYNSGRITRIWKIPGEADYTHYGIAAYNNGTIEYHADAAGDGGTANKNAVEAAVVFNNTNGTCTLTIPTLYRSRGSSRRGFLRNNYVWFIW